MNEEITAYYLTNFWGYGNWDSDYWFVGMEEGGGNDLQLVVNKIDSFFQNGYSHEHLIDNYHFQVNLVGEPHNKEALRFLGPRPNNRPVALQNYWAKMIKILLHLNLLNSNNSAIRNYQKDHWGRIHNNDYFAKHAVIELFPLPSQNTNEWNYSEWTNHFENNFCPPLLDREGYFMTISNNRITLLQNKIREYQPRLVVFSGLTHQNYYDQIVGCNNWELLDQIKCYFQKVNNTLFVKTNHPNTWGIGHAYWNIVSDEILQRLNS
jgi:hypothetical protein